MKLVIEVDLETFPTVDRLSAAVAHMAGALETIPSGVDARAVLKKNDGVDYAILGEMTDDETDSICHARTVIVRSDFNTDVLHRKQTHLQSGSVSERTKI